MGSYGELRVGATAIESWKNEIEPTIMTLFVEGDKHVNPISLETWISEGGDEENWSSERSSVAYICTVGEMKDRLDVRGFTAVVAGEAFKIGVKRRIRELTQSLERFASLESQIVIENGAPEYLAKRSMELRTLAVLRTISPSSWLDAFRRASRDGRCGRHIGYEEVSDLDPETQYVMSWSFSQYGFPSADLRCMFRLALEAFSPDEKVTYDLTDLVISGCFDAEEEMIRYADYLISREYDVNRTTVVLTEGSTDRWIIERTMRVICPHIAPFFSFMDFDGVRMEGGAGALANMVKAFAGAGILNRVIALFDNDTAGSLALQNLKRIALPPNIKVFTLPPIDVAKQYPTLGPSGVSVMDINGMACGIELYLGNEILTEPDGTLAPVQWKGYDVKLRQYQGELLSKGEMTDRFQKKLAVCESDRSRLTEYDWEGLVLIINLLRTAFNEEDAKAHLEYEDWLDTAD